MTPHAASNSITGFDAQTTKPSERSISATSPLRSQPVSPLVHDRTITKSFTPPLDLVNLNTVYTISSCTLVFRWPQVLATHGQSFGPQSLGPSLTSVLHRSQFIGTNPLDLLHNHRPS
jgi:hypothetical protein